MSGETKRKSEQLEELAREVLDIEAQLAVAPGAGSVEIAAEDWDRLVKMAREVRS